MFEDRLVWLTLIGIVALIGFWWGITNTRRVIEFPFLYSMGMLVFILPQGYAICNNPGRVPDDAFHISVAMILLCSFAIYVGYFGKSVKHSTPPLSIYRIDSNKLFLFGLCVSILGTIGTIKLGDPSLVKVWRGWPVYWGTLSRINLPGVIMMILASVISKKYRYILIPLLFSYFPFLTIILRGRRSMTILLPVMYLMPFLLCNRRLRIPRLLVITSLVAACVIIYAFPVWRDRFDEREHLEAIKDAPVTSIAEDLTYSKNERTLELVGGMLIMGAVWERSVYQLGAVSIYNSIIGSYVPGGLVGREFKSSLFAKTPSTDITQKVYGITIATYTGKTIYADLFKDFGFFGAIILFWLARIYKKTHFLAVNYHDGRAMLFLCAFAVLPAHMIEAGLLAPLTSSIPVVALLLLGVKYCMIQTHL